MRGIKGHFTLYLKPKNCVSGWFQSSLIYKGLFQFIFFNWQKNFDNRKNW